MFSPSVDDSPSVNVSLAVDDPDDPPAVDDPDDPLAVYESELAKLRDPTELLSSR